MNFIAFISVFIMLAFGFALSFVKDAKVLWVMVCTALSAQIAVIIYIFINYSHESEAFRALLFGNVGISFSINEMGLLYSAISAVMWLVSAIVSTEYFSHHSENLNSYYASFIIALAGTLGVFWAEDLFTLFVFFEIMSFSSYIWVAHNRDKKSNTASVSYLTYAVVGGLSLLFGIFIYSSIASDLTIANIPENVIASENSAMLILAVTFMLVGFGAKAGMCFLHEWLPQAHTASPAPASGLLSGLLTKTGVYGIIIVILKIVSENKNVAFVLLLLSALGMLVGAVYAFFSKDLKRTLAYSSVSQIGFILWGVSLNVLLGDHNTYAAYGTVFHMINHSLIKVLLFSSAGVVYQNAHTLDLNELKGYGKDKPWLAVVFGTGALSLMGVPLFSGYISKTLLHEAVVELIHFTEGSTALYTALEWLFLLSGGFTFAYMLKLFICLFVRKPEREIEKKPYVTAKSKIALSIIAVSLVVLGSLPNQTFGEIGEFTSHFLNTHAAHEIHYFSWINLKGSVISISIGLVLYFLLATKTVASVKNGYNDYNSTQINLERFIYRPIASALYFVCSLVFRTVDISADVLVVVINKLFFKSIVVPKTFLEGKPMNDGRDKEELHISYSLSYSLLLFGIGFIFTIAYLLFIGAN